MWPVIAAKSPSQNCCFHSTPICREEYGKKYEIQTKEEQSSGTPCFPWRFRLRITLPLQNATSKSMHRQLRHAALPPATTSRSLQPHGCCSSHPKSHSQSNGRHTRRDGASEIADPVATSPHLHLIACADKRGWLKWLNWSLAVRGRPSRARSWQLKEDLGLVLNRSGIGCPRVRKRNCMKHVQCELRTEHDFFVRLCVTLTV